MHSNPFSGFEHVAAIYSRVDERTRLTPNLYLKFKTARIEKGLMNLQETIEQQFAEIKGLSGEVGRHKDEQKEIELLKADIQDYQKYLLVLPEKEIIERARVNFSLEKSMLELKNLEAQLAGQPVEEIPCLSRLQQLYELLNTTNSLTKQLKAYLSKLTDSESWQYKTAIRDLKRLAELEEPWKAELIAIQDKKLTDEPLSKLLLEIQDATYRVEQHLIVVRDSMDRAKLKYCLEEFNKQIEQVNVGQASSVAGLQISKSLAEQVLEYVEQSYLQRYKVMCDRLNKIRLYILFGSLVMNIRALRREEEELDDEIHLLELQLPPELLVNYQPYEELKARLLTLQEEIKSDLALIDDPRTRARHEYYLEKVQEELERIETEEKRMMRGRK